MGRGILLWLLGVPIPVIILLWLFFGRLPSKYPSCSGSVISWRSLIFLRTMASNFLNAGALFRSNSAMTPEQADQAGAKHRDG
jgi:hypothetical protein